MKQEVINDISWDGLGIIDSDENFDDESALNENVNAIKSMWRAVITQALMDAASKSKKRENLKAKREAKEWLLGNSDDFLSVCCLADMNPSYVKKKIKLALARGCTWRNDKKKKSIEKEDIYYKEAV